MAKYLHVTFLLRIAYLVFFLNLRYIFLFHIHFLISHLFLFLIHFPIYDILKYTIPKKMVSLRKYNVIWLVLISLLFNSYLYWSLYITYISCITFRFQHIQHCCSSFRQRLCSRLIQFFYYHLHIHNLYVLFDSFIRWCDTEFHLIYMLLL